MKQYCEMIHQSKRWKTREVKVGNIGVGGDNPVRIQSMTNSSTRDVEATVEQIIRLADVGCEIARVTVQGNKEAEACEQIKNNLLQKGYDIPLVADIHFYPPAAMKVVEFLDKVRVNPGNFVDKRATFKDLEFDDDSYAKELAKIDEKFSPLVLKCKQLGRSMRIGCNHGSLSDRILNRYGDTPEGMVQSALEFADVCRKHDFHEFIFSMKSSIPQVMVAAYRLLVAEMRERDWNYPLHLGVTEAGEGEDGRIKSAMGIGALLLDGLGDTVRVSLTEDPWAEIAPCKELVRFAEMYQGRGVAPFEEHYRDITNIQKRSVTIPAQSPLHRDGSVYVAVKEADILKETFFEDLGCGVVAGRPTLKKACADGVLLRKLPSNVEAQEKLHLLIESGIGVVTPDAFEGATPLISLEVLRESPKTLFASPVQNTGPRCVVVEGGEGEASWNLLKNTPHAFILFSPKDTYAHKARRFFEFLKREHIELPVILDYHYDCSKESLFIHASAEVALSFCDGVGNGVCLETEALSLSEKVNFGFNLLQAARMRTFKTDFISCPSCGRTLFDLQKVSERIRQRTGHLPGVKIAIMGCIVNGPGEMADADFGYVGSRPGKVDLYVGKECVEKNIDFDEADDRLVELLKTHGRWKEPEVEAPLQQPILEGV